MHRARSLPASEKLWYHEEEVDDVEIELNARDYIVVVAHAGHDLMGAVDYEGTK
jgi:hypothetical protein